MCRLFSKTILSMTVALLLLPQFSYAEKRVFLFGYGSLMSTHSRTSSAPDPENIRFIPVKLNNHARTWNLWMKRIGMRVLGVEERSQSFLNGLIYEVPRENLSKFDSREGPAYRRSRLVLEDLTFYDPEDSLWFSKNRGNIEVYAYKPIKQDISQGGYYLTNPLIHSRKTIAQSYLHIVVAGCIEVDNNNDLGGAFLSDCIATLGHKGLPVEQDSANPKSPSHPLNQVIKSKDQLSKREEYLRKEWQNYLQQIRVLLETD